jgi:luciferase family oxidoreductase group 1
MLPNHSPLVIAEQFGTLETLHPGRIDLGLGRAPGTDQVTVKAMRRDMRASDNFAQDVQELQGFLSDTSRVTDVIATPGKGTHVPLYILGSSLYGAQLAAVLGLPFAFASHFAPASLLDALRIYRERFTPSAQLDRPHAIASMSIIAADTEESALAQLDRRKRSFARRIFGRPGNPLSDEQLEAVLNSPQASYLDEVFTYSAVGTPSMVKTKLDEFQALTQADEIITVHHADGTPSRLRSIELLAQVANLEMVS